MRDLKNQINNSIANAIQTLRSHNSPSSSKDIQEVIDELSTIRNNFSKILSIVELSEDVADIGFWWYDYKHDNIDWSEETYRIWRYNPDDIVLSQKHFEDRIHPDDMEDVKKTYKQTLTDREDYHVIYRLQFPDDTIKYIEAFGKHIYDEEGNPEYTVGTNQNVTKRELEKRELQTSLNNHQTSLDEIHHRVKNNLGILASTMQLQLLEENDEEFRNKLLDSTNRIRTIANVHEQLYQSNNIDELPLGKNIEKIASDLIQAMPVNSDIQLDARCDEIYLNNQKSLTCSLLTNEIITNALKHAFENQASGEISIRLKEKDEMIFLAISDDGKGLPDDYEQKTASSLGMELIRTLCKQLDAFLDIESSNAGTTFTITFEK